MTRTVLKGLAALASAAVLVLTGCGAAARAKGEPDTPGRETWHDTSTPHTMWACLGRTLVLRYWDYNSDSPSIAVASGDPDNLCGPR
jgi:hypothetical protein